MKSMIVLEFRRALISGSFFLALTVGTVLAVSNIILISAPLALSEGWSLWRNGYDGVYPPSFFGNWIGQTPYTITTSIFYYIFPLLACIPFAASLSTDLSSRYASQVIIRKGRFSYFVAKAIVVFLVSGSTVLIPLVINIVGVACLLPQLAPDPTTNTFAVMPSAMLAQLFYAHPWCHIAIFLLITFVASGIFSLMTVVLSFFIHNRLVVLLAPFAFCVTTQLITQGTFLAGFAPLNVVMPAQPFPSIFWVDLLSIGLSLCVLVIVLLKKSSQFEEI